jgi:Phage DNA packaging protein Nu1
MFMSQRPGRTVNRAELAQTFGVTLPTVDRWVSAGCPFLKRGGNGRKWSFDTAATHRWLIDRNSADVASAYGGGPNKEMSIAEARRRKAVCDLLLAEIAADRELRKVVDIEYVAERFAVALHQVKTALMQLGPHVAGRAASMSSAPAIRDLVEREVRNILIVLRRNLLSPDVVGAAATESEPSDDDGRAVAPTVQTSKRTHGKESQ